MDGWSPSLVAFGCVLGYTFGSVPFGLLLTRSAGLGDIRAIGSGNIGATNVLRTGHKGLAAATLFLDALKGTAAILLAGYIWGPDAALGAGIGAFIGHTFPVWLGFRGGKGVATYIGCLLAFDLRALLAFAIVWLGVAAATRYSSLAALTASVVAPVLLWFLGDGRVAAVIAILAAMLWARHRPNIARLLSGREGRIGQKA